VTVRQGIFSDIWVTDTPGIFSHIFLTLTQTDSQAGSQESRHRWPVNNLDLLDGRSTKRELLHVMD
jgi:hypothetical protein